MRILAISGAPKAGMFLRRWTDNGHQTQSIALAELEKRGGIVDADVILLDLGGSAGGDFATLARHLEGKIVIDCSNPADLSDLRGGAGSIAERIADACPGAAVVKALNVISAPALERMLTQGGAERLRGYTSGYFCGDHEDARRTAAALIDEVHLDAIDCGPLANATLLEALGLLTRHLETQATSGADFIISIVKAHGDSSPLDRWM